MAPLAGKDGMYHTVFRVRGRVQGVFFRASAQEEARKLGVGGYARNNLDGSVEIAAHGSREAVASLLDWARQGPPMAVVEALWFESPLVRVDDDSSAPAGFEIKRG